MRRVPILVAFGGGSGSGVKRYMETIHKTCAAYNTEPEIFLDSGAYSAMTQGKPIKVADYIAFVKEVKHLVAHYANLDVIGDHIQTQRNQEEMEKAGLLPMPIFHQGSPLSVLQQMLDNYTGKICIGGLVASRMATLTAPIFLGACAEIIESHYSKQPPKSNIHLFGMSPTPSILEISRVWKSFDSSTGSGYRFGIVYTPNDKKVSLSALNTNRRKQNLVLGSILRIPCLSDTTKELIRENRRGTRGARAGSYWDMLGVLSVYWNKTSLLDYYGMESSSFFVVMNEGYPRPYLDILISGMRDINENRGNRLPKDSM